MSERLVTVATFDQPAQARLAENVLKEAGIRAAVSDEQLVAMDWLLSSAVGGVKVQVWEEDAERAVAVLENQFGENGEGFGTAVPPEELAAQAEAAGTADGQGGAERDGPAVEPEPVEPPPAPGGREDYAQRLVFASILGLIVPPVSAYALYLLFNAAFGEGPLSSRGRFNVWLGGLMTFCGLTWVFFFLSLWRS